MVHIHGLVAGIVVLGQNAVGNVARLGDRTAGHDVGNTEALAVLVVSTFALIGGSGAAPQKSIGKSHVGSFRTCWGWLRGRRSGVRREICVRSEARAGTAATKPAYLLFYRKPPTTPQLPK